MIIAQVIIILPIIAALSSQIFEDLHEEYRDLFTSLVVPAPKALLAYIIDARYSLLTIILAGFGRAISRGRRGNDCRREYRPFNPGNDHGNCAGNLKRGIGTCPGTWHHSASAGIAGKFCRTAI